MKKLFASLLIIVLVLSSNIYSSVHSQAASPNVQSNSYDMIREALLKNDTFGKFDANEVNPNEVGSLIKRVVQENPEILYYKSAKVWTSGKIEFIYYISNDKIAAHKSALNKRIDKVLVSIQKSTKTDFEKVKAVHDYLVLNTSYDYKNQQNKTIPAESYTAFGALVNNIAVCDGYTKAAQILLNRLGIENDYVVGTVDGNLHSWNQVKLNNTYYFMDITWDDPVPNKPGKVDYSYFLVSSTQLKKDHAWNEAQYAKASDNFYSYINLQKK